MKSTSMRGGSGRRYLGAACVAMALVAGSAHAAITGGSASFLQLSGASLPAAVATNAINVDGRLFGFDEAIVTLDSEFSIGGNILATGTRVASHLIFFDPSSKGNSVSGSVSFDGSIIGLITGARGIKATNSLFGLDGVTYGTKGSFGLENGDSVSVAVDDGAQLDLSLGERGKNPIGDYVRVLTVAPTIAAPVPEPSTYAMFGAGLLWIGLLARRRLG